MFTHRSWVVVSSLLLSGVGRAEQEVEPPRWEETEALIQELEQAMVPEASMEVARPDASDMTTPWMNVLRLETTTWTLLPRGGAGEGFVQVEPLVVLEQGEGFRLNVGAPLRLRLWGGGAGAGFVRKEDWDTLSDWGQVVRQLSVGVDASRAVWVGRMDGYSLLSGHLVRRYSNQLNPDYHPAGLVAAGTLGPVYAEAFASDLLGARLAGAEVALDVQHVLFVRPEVPGRYTLSLSAVHDWGRAGGVSESMTLAHVDGTAVVLRRRSQGRRIEVHVLGGWGGRPGEGGAWGAVAGVGMEMVSTTLDLRARLEGRLQRGGFRQGAFGPDYELARFRVVGPSAMPLAEAAFPGGGSAYGEVILGWDAVRLSGMRQRHVFVSLGVEVFTWGRVDVDGRVETQLFHRDLSLGAGGLATGMGQSGARYLVSAEARWRFLGGRLFAVGQGGTLLFPTPERALRPGAFVGVGLGVDNVR